jgi:hypothetical protein
VRLLDSSSRSVESVQAQRLGHFSGDVQWASKNWPAVYRYTLMFGLRPTTSPPLASYQHCKQELLSQKHIPELSELAAICIGQDGFLQSCFKPEPICKSLILYLEAIATEHLAPHYRKT